MSSLTQTQTHNSGLRRCTMTLSWANKQLCNKNVWGVSTARISSPSAEDVNAAAHRLERPVGALDYNGGWNGEKSAHADRHQHMSDCIGWRTLVRCSFTETGGDELTDNMSKLLAIVVKQHGEPCCIVLIYEHLQGTQRSTHPTCCTFELQDHLFAAVQPNELTGSHLAGSPPAEECRSKPQHKVQHGMDSSQVSNRALLRSPE